MSRPVRPALLIAMAEFWALADDRCFSTLHNEAMTSRGVCPSCLLSVGSYVSELQGISWPNS